MNMRGILHKRQRGDMERKSHIPAETHRGYGVDGHGWGVKAKSALIKKNHNGSAIKNARYSAEKTPRQSCRPSPFTKVKGAKKGR